jgi:toxin ParE1/3/4
LKRIRWAPAAADDLENIRNYLSEHHPSLVQSTIRKLYDAALSLKRFPNRGRIGHKEGTRELIMAPAPYIIVYCVERDIVQIFRVMRSEGKAASALESFVMGNGRTAYSDGSIARVNPDTPVIWRYMDLGKFVSMLEHGGLYFPVVAALGDELEAVRPRLPDGSSETEEWKRWQEWNMARYVVCASCWHCAPDESAAMWEIYAGRNQGIAVRSTTQALSDAFPVAESDDKGQLVEARLVEYIDPDLREPMTSSGRFDLVTRKRRWYCYENELRVVWMAAKNWEEPPGLFDLGNCKSVGFWLTCDLRELIQEVVVAPKAPPYLESVVREVFQRFGFAPQLVRPSKMTETMPPPDPALVQDEWKKRNR